MGNLFISFSLVILLATLPWTQSLRLSKTRNCDSEKQTETRFQFYFHDTNSGKAPTSVKVAGPSISANSPTMFGALFIADDPLTESPDPKSKEIGRSQGLYGASGQQELGLIMAMSFQFTAGDFNGSSILIVAKNSVYHPVRELPIIGGTGVFRLARGYALARNYFVNSAFDSIVGYNVTVLH